MARKSNYDAMIYLRKIKDLGLDKFTAKQLKKIDLYDSNCHHTAASCEFIRIYEKSRDGITTWEFNPDIIRKSSKNKIFFD